MRLSLRKLLCLKSFFGKYLNFFIWIICGVAYGQQWKAVDVDYAEEMPVKKKYYEIKGDVPEIVFKVLVNGYRLFISDPDGENCPFSPSCSRFFVEALGKTNLIEAVLLTSDRLIRDTSFDNKYKHYHIDRFGYLIDPPLRYINRK